MSEKQLVVKRLLNTNPFEIRPESMKELREFSELIKDSELVPINFRGKPADIILAIQLGAEVGLKPMQALQGIAVINGKPTMYGDSLLAVCRAHPDFVSIEETFDDIKMQAICSIQRKGQPICIRSFSKQDAELAGLWNRQGPWRTYPKRMLLMRARGFAIRDAFADAIKGLMPREEVEDYQPIEVIRKGEDKVTVIKEKTYKDYLPLIEKTEDIKELENIYRDAKEICFPDELEIIVNKCKERKEELLKECMEFMESKNEDVVACDPCNGIEHPVENYGDKHGQ